MSNLEEHDAEQAEITARCEAGTCGHPECTALKKSWHSIALELCPDGCIHNDLNEERASKALLCFYPSYDDNTARMGLGDLMVDIRHLCDLMGWDFHELCDQSYQTYSEEVRDCGTAKHDEFKAAIERDLQ